jgi:hypothetical protein
MFHLIRFVLMVAGMWLGWVAGDSVRDHELDRAVNLLDDARRSREVLAYLHFGATYKSHELRSVRVSLGDGANPFRCHFVIQMAYQWTCPLGAETTLVEFHFDEKGRVYDLRADSSSLHNAPFVAATATIRTLGKLIVGVFGSRMSRNERHEFHRLVDAGDAKGLLILTLNHRKRRGN